MCNILYIICKGQISGCTLRHLLAMASRLYLGIIVVFVLCIVGVIIFSSKTYFFREIINIVRPSSVDLSETYKQERNEISKMMNSFKQEFAVLSCEMITLKRKLNETKSSVSASGGWCKHESSNKSGEHRFDKRLAKKLSSFFKSKSVASFGDGPGDYKRYLDSTHSLSVYDAYDGAPYGPETSGGAVKFLDLTAPQYGLPVYDWIMSLEVAEHIPTKYESIFIDNIVRHAGTGIVMSWAVPGQGGLSHVNNRPLSYVKKVLSEKGFDINMETSKMLQKAASLGWLKRNIYVYYRREGSSASLSHA